MPVFIFYSQEVGLASEILPARFFPAQLDTRTEQPSKRRADCPICPPISFKTTWPEGFTPRRFGNRRQPNVGLAIRFGNLRYGAGVKLHPILPRFSCRTSNCLSPCSSEKRTKAPGHKAVCVWPLRWRRAFH